MKELAVLSVLLATSFAADRRFFTGVQKNSYNSSIQQDSDFFAFQEPSYEGVGDVSHSLMFAPNADYLDNFDPSFSADSKVEERRESKQESQREKVLHRRKPMTVEASTIEHALSLEEQFQILDTQIMDDSLNADHEKRRVEDRYEGVRNTQGRSSSIPPTPKIPFAMRSRSVSSDEEPLGRKSVSFDLINIDVRDYHIDEPIPNVKSFTQGEIESAKPKKSILRKRKMENATDLKQFKRASTDSSNVNSVSKILDGVSLVNDLVSEVTIPADSFWDCYEFVGSPNHGRMVLFGLKDDVKVKDVYDALGLFLDSGYQGDSGLPCLEFDSNGRRRDVRPRYLVKLVRDLTLKEKPFAFVEFTYSDTALEMVNMLRGNTGHLDRSLGPLIGIDLCPMRYFRKTRTIIVNRHQKAGMPGTTEEALNNLKSYKFWKNRGTPLARSVVTTDVAQITFHQQDHAAAAKDYLNKNGIVSVYSS